MQIMVELILVLIDVLVVRHNMLSTVVIVAVAVAA